MALTATEMRNMVKKAIVSRSDFSDTELDTYLELSQERIARQKRWRELQNTTDLSITAAGTAAADKIIDLSNLTNLDKIYSFVIENDAQSVKLVQVETGEFDNRIPLPEYFSRDTPSFYTLWGIDSAILHPVPDATYTGRIRWYKWPANFTATNTTSDLLRKDDMIVFLTISFVFALLREEETANRFFSYYRNELETSKIDNEDIPDLVVRPNFGLASRANPREYYHDPFSDRTR